MCKFINDIHMSFIAMCFEEGNSQKNCYHIKPNLFKTMYFKLKANFIIPYRMSCAISKIG